MNSLGIILKKTIILSCLRCIFSQNISDQKNYLTNIETWEETKEKYFFKQFNDTDFVIVI